MIFKRKLYDKMLEWKQQSNGKNKKALTLLTAM